jgi:hypothetical protein
MEETGWGYGGVLGPYTERPSRGLSKNTSCPYGFSSTSLAKVESDNNDGRRVPGGRRYAFSVI